MSPAQCKAKEGLGCPAAFRYRSPMENFQSIIEQVGMLVDAAGVLVIVVGILAASVRALMPSPQPEGLDHTAETG